MQDVHSMLLSQFCEAVQSLLDVSNPNAFPNWHLSSDGMYT